MRNQNTGYYLLYRKNKQTEWKYNINQSFLVNVSNDCIVGQYISSNWFKLVLNEGDSLDIVVIQSQDMNNTTIQRVIALLNEAQIQNSQLMELSFVITYTEYSSKRIELLRDELLASLNKCQYTNSKNDFIPLARGINTGLHFTINKDIEKNIECKNKQTKSNVELYVTSPRFELNLY